MTTIERRKKLAIFLIFIFRSPKILLENDVKFKSAPNYFKHVSFQYPQPTAAFIILVNFKNDI
ncbi:Putative uncharacterized protein [Moritella viscosa]|uniref:Uncharacterized protein n=1 Tax=Moritella viscosa TaxID=80854 RepID=A0A1L0BVH8_9GAMM|nr:Putative uncharacterized protein [Moritella viscosa]SGZ03831.1 Putative uncharacterized protein [Moritella viscosa]SHN99491.1 Putative uncharacterized protein [Moritella viscosa]SHO00763.1 Putative uncharacterized protein [Moritella viscosa]SHO01986.1 Putative uncharacterized protein [Moritella viscosa]